MTLDGLAILPLYFWHFKSTIYLRRDVFMWLHLDTTHVIFDDDTEVCSWGT